MHLHEFEGVLHAAQVGADWAWSRIYDSYAQRLLGYLRSQGAVDPDGLLGDVLLQIARNIHSFEGDESGFRSWIFLVAHNRVLDERRRRGRKPQQELVASHYPATESAEHSAFESMSMDAAMALLDGLTDDQREVIALRFLAELSLEETASIMDKNINAIKQLQHRAIGALRKKMPARP